MSGLGGDVDLESLRVSTSSGRLRIVGEDRLDVDVNGRAEVSEERGQTTVVGGSNALVVRVPRGCDVVAGTASGRVTLEGDLGDVAVVSDSGRVQVERARSADVRTSSGRIEAGHISGELRAHTANGRLTAEACGAADVSTVSGRITLAAAAGPVRAHCTSGRIEISMVTADDVEAETVSGRITVTMPTGTRVHRPEDAAEPRPPDCDCVVVARSVSGRVTVS